MKELIKQFKSGELFAGIGMMAMLFLLMDYLGFNEKFIKLKLTDLEVSYIFIVAFPIFLVGIKMMLIHAEKKGDENVKK